MALFSFVIMFYFGNIKANAQIIDRFKNCGATAVLDNVKTEEEYISIAQDTSYSYGYKHLGVADVDNHLNVREAPSTEAKLVGKMSILTIV